MARRSYGRYTSRNVARTRQRQGIPKVELERLTWHLLWMVTFYDRWSGEDGLLKIGGKNGRFDVETVRWQGEKGRELVSSAVRCYDLPLVQDTNTDYSGSEVVDM